MAYYQTDNGLDLNFDTDPEERKRRLAAMAGLITGQQGIQDLAGNMFDQRIQPIQQMVEDPELAMRKRLGMQTQQPQPQQMAPVSGPVQPQMPDETAAETQRLLQQNQMAQGTPVQQTPMAPIMPDQVQTQIVQPKTVGAEQQMPTMPVNPEVVNEVNQTQLPVAGPGVQVAGAPGTQMPTTQAAPAPVPQWSQDLTNAQGDITKLHAIAGNPNYPEEARRLAGELTNKVYKGKVEEDKANNTIQNAFSGQDPKALNQVMSDLRKSSNEGSYLKAILYGRLGLTELAREEQQKLGAGVKIGQSMIDGKQYTVEYGGNGDVKRAWDANGVRVGDEGLAKISAGGMKPGTHAFGFTGERAVVPSGQKGAGEEVVPYTNSITRDVGYVYATGPFKGETYTGSTPQAKRVDTHSQIALNDALIKFQTAPTTAMATEMLKLAGQVDSGDGRTIQGVMARIQQLSPTIFNQVKGTAPTLQPQAQPSNVPQAQPSNVPQAQPNNVPQARPAGPVNPAQPQPQAQPVMGGGGSLTTQKAQQEANVAINKELVVAEKKPPAEAKGKNEAQDINNQRFADEAYTSIRPIAELVKKSTGSGLGTSVDQLAAYFGKGTEGAQAIAELEPMVYPLIANVPRFQGSQSDYDVKMYQKAAGDFANSEKPVKTRLAALQGMITLLKKYDKEGKNDWSFSSGTPANSTGIKIIKREKVQ